MKKENKITVHLGVERGTFGEKGIIETCEKCEYSTNKGTNEDPKEYCSLFEKELPFQGCIIIPSTSQYIHGNHIACPFQFGKPLKKNMGYIYGKGFINL